MGALSGKAVVITGAGRGIGRAIAIGAAAEGASVVVADYGVELDGTAPSSSVALGVTTEISETGGIAIAATDSVSTLVGARRLVSACVDAFGSVDGVVCCAGILRHAPFQEMSEDDFASVIDTHLKGHFNMFRAVVERPERGRMPSLIAISSGYVTGDPVRANYRAAKAGVIALMLSVAQAGVSGGFRCNGISPMANTRMTQDSGLVMDGEPEDVAPMAVYLLSDASQEINGHLFSVRGDRIASWRDAIEERMIRGDGGLWSQDHLREQVPWLYDTTDAGVPSDPVTGWLERHHR